MSYANPIAYQEFMGRWSARLAPAFLRFVGIEDGWHVLDVGCGTGNLSRALVAFGDRVSATGIDPTADYVAFAHEAVPHPRARFLLAAAESLPFANGTFQAALALLVLQDFGDPRRAVLEMARVTRPGGVVAACMWDFRDGLPMFQLLWQAAEAVAAEAVSRHRDANPSRQHFAPDELRALWRDCRLSGVETQVLELSMPFLSFDDYWRPFLGGATRTSRFAAAADAETGGAVRSALAARIIGVQPDGSFVLPARAWAVKGTVTAR